MVEDGVTGRARRAAGGSPSGTVIVAYDIAHRALKLTTIGLRPPYGSHLRSHDRQDRRVSWSAEGFGVEGDSVSFDYLSSHDDHGLAAQLTAVGCVFLHPHQ